jgi:hypothetical protein
VTATLRPGRLVTIVGAVTALVGGFAPWYEATVTYGGQAFRVLDQNGWENPNAGISILAIALCIVAGAVALAELIVPDAHGPQSPAQVNPLVPIGLGFTALALVIAKYVDYDPYASVGFLVTGTGALLVIAGGVWLFVARAVSPS